MSVRDPSRRSDVPSSLGAVSRVVSAQCIKVDGVPRHVRDLRPAVVPEPAEGERVPSGDNDDDDDSAPIIRDGAELLEVSRQGNNVPLCCRNNCQCMFAAL